MRKDRDDGSSGSQYGMGGWAESDATLTEFRSVASLVAADFMGEERQSEYSSRSKLHSYCHSPARKVLANMGIDGDNS